MKPQVETILDVLEWLKSLPEDISIPLTENALEHQDKFLKAGIGRALATQAALAIVYAENIYAVEETISGRNYNELTD